MNKLAQIYEGKAKILFSTEEPTQLIQYFKDDATAFNGQKKSSLVGTGILNNFISEFPSWDSEVENTILELI